MCKFLTKTTIVMVYLVTFTSFLYAQVTIESKMTSNGIAGQGAFESKTKTMIQGDSRRTETEFKFTGSIMKHFNTNVTDIEITRLDKELFWRFNNKENTYTESTFAEMKEMMEKGMAETGWPAEEGTEVEETETDDSDYEWQEPVVEVKKRGNSQKINNYNCENYLVTVTTIGKHKATGIMDTLLFSTDLWNTTEVKKPMEIVSNFDKRFTDALGFSWSSNKGMAQIFNMYRDQMEDMNKELKKIEGFSLKTDMTFTMTNHAKPSAETDEDQEEADVALDDIKGSLGGLFGKKLGKMAKKKVEKKPSDSTNIFQGTNEVQKINVKNINPEDFTVPGNYKLLQ